jgi:ribA/ribD-fused uncharacterized protein
MSTLSVAQVRAAIAGGAQPEFLFFWGHRPRRDGSLGPSCLSQWWPAEFEVDGQRFASAEHWMMWRKALLFDDDDAARRVLQADTPAEAKKLGAQVRGFEPSAWEAERFAVVVAGNRAKFGQHPELAGFLSQHGAPDTGGGQPRRPDLGYRAGRRRCTRC